MLPKYLHSKAAFFSSFLLAAALAAFFFEPEVVSVYWHLRFGNATSIDGWRYPFQRDGGHLVTTISLSSRGGDGSMTKRNLLA